MGDADEIRTLKHEYCWAFDADDLAGVMDLFTDDAVCDLGPFGTVFTDNVTGRDL
jgi:ketosteroid isomerase-like protein